MKWKALALVAGLILSSVVVFAQPEKVNAFVCPVITAEAVGVHNPVAGELGATGTYTVVPTTANNGDLTVPIHATNMDGNGVPGGPQSEPGDTDYTAIWHG